MLVKNGVPFDVAFAMAECDPLMPELIAWTIIFGEIEGGTFDWDRFEWKKNDP